MYATILIKAIYEHKTSEGNIVGIKVRANSVYEKEISVDLSDVRYSRSGPSAHMLRFEMSERLMESVEAEFNSLKSDQRDHFRRANYKFKCPDDNYTSPDIRDAAARVNASKAKHSGVRGDF